MQQQTFDLGDLVGFSGIWNVRMLGTGDSDWVLVVAPNAISAAQTYALRSAAEAFSLVGNVNVEVQGTEPNARMQAFKVEHETRIRVNSLTRESDT